MVVSTGGNILWTCDSEVIVQVTERRHDFVKPLDMLGMLNMYGPTVTASEGEENRTYRKVAAPLFNEKNHQLVWDEAISQASAMLRTWSHNEGEIVDLNHDAARLALHVISRVFFNNEIQWTDQAQAPPAGHALTYSFAISSVFKYNSTLFLTPPVLLSKLGRRVHKEMELLADVKQIIHQ